MRTTYAIILALLLVGCQTYQDQVVQPTGPLPPPEPPAPLPSKITPEVTFTKIPEFLVSGQAAQFTWEVKGGKIVEHTNVHTSFTSDFAERIDTEKQPGSAGEYSDMLVLESEQPRTVYIRAHANIDGVDYKSDAISLELQVISNTEMQVSPTNFNADIAGFSFKPATIKIKAGDTVVWEQQDTVPHTVTTVSGPESFGSGNLGNGQTFSHTFNTPGTYEYQCSIHPTMRGKVIVE